MIKLIFPVLGLIFYNHTFALEAIINVDQPAWFDTNAASPSGTGLSVTKGLTPFGVFFQGWQSTPRNEVVEYEWNFGDPTAKGKNLNILKGFNSAHVFENDTNLPVTYRVTLTIKNRDGQTASSYKDITVLPRNTFTSGRTFYIDPAGNDSFTGLCKTIPTSGDCGPWKTAEKAIHYLHASSTNSSLYRQGDSILFKRGGRYPLNTVYTARVYAANLLFGAYGDGAKPVIYYNGTTKVGIMVELVPGSHDVAFVDLEFQMKNPNYSARMGGVVKAIAFAKAIILLRVDIYDPNTQAWGFNYVHQTDPLREEAIVTAFFMVDSSIRLNYYGVNAVTDPNFAAGDMYYGFIRNAALIGNVFDKSYGHIAYLSHLNKAVIVNNIYSRPAFGRNALRICGKMVNGDGTNNVYVADNLFMGWRDPESDTVVDNGGAVHNGNGRYNFLLVTIGPKGSGDYLVKDVIFERNIFTNFEKAIVLADAENNIVRNNLFVSHNDAARTDSMLAIGMRDYEVRPSKNITIAGNTFIGRSLSNVDTSAHSSVISISPFNQKSGTNIQYGSEHEKIKIYNNILYHTANSSNILLSLNYLSPNLMKQLYIGGNMYYSPSALSTGKVFAVGNTSYYTLSEWKTLGSQYGQSYDSRSQVNVAPWFAQSVALKAYAVGEPTTLTETVTQTLLYRDMFKLKPDATNPAVDNGIEVDLLPISNGGVDLKDLLAYDFSGNQRPDGNWISAGKMDVGAFEVAFESPRLGTTSSTTVPPITTTSTSTSPTTSTSTSTTTSTPTSPTTSPTPAPTFTTQVTSLTLINSGTNMAMGSLGNGMTIDLATIGFSNFNVKANLSATSGSVKFIYDNYVRYENSSPYSLFSDNSGDYLNSPLTVGNHHLVVTPYSSTNGSGTAGQSYVVDFTIIDSRTLDTAAPVSTALNSGTWKGPRAFEIKANEPATVYYCVTQNSNCTPNVKGDTSLWVILNYSSRKYLLKFYSIDRAGNKEVVQERVYKITK